MVESNLQMFSLWIGPKFISIGNTMKVGERYLFKKQGLFSRYVPINANAKNIPFQDRIIFDPIKGDTGITLRIFWSDIDLNGYVSKVNAEDINTINHLKKMLIARENELDMIYKRINNSTTEDGIKKLLHDLKDKSNIMNGYNNNQFGGIGGGFNSFGSKDINL